MIQRTRRRKAAIAGATGVFALLLAACQTVVVENGVTSLTVSATRQVQVPLRCNETVAEGGQTCTGTVRIRLGGVDTPAVSFSVAPETVSTATVVLTTGQYALVPPTGGVDAEIVIDQAAPKNPEVAASPIVLRRPPPPIERISVTATGGQVAHGSADPSLSGDGRYVAFESYGDLLGDGATGGHVYLKDRVVDTVDRISVSSAEVAGNAQSADPSISTFLRYVAFSSNATNLVASDTNGASDIFVRDRTDGTTERVSISSGALQGNGDSTNPALSGDGRWVAFTSTASNLVSGDLPGTGDVFLHDRTSDTTTRVSVSSAGTPGNGASYGATISDDGRYVAFVSTASNLVAGDTNGVADVFVRDRVANTTTRVSVATGGGQADQPVLEAAISGSANAVAFWTEATNLVAGDQNGNWDVFVRDLGTATTTRVSVDPQGAGGDGYSLDVAISDDGRHVAFRSDATNLAPGVTGDHWDVFLHDRTTGVTRLATLASNGGPVDGDIEDVALSGNGSVLAFTSSSTNLIAGDTNGVSDVFGQEQPAG